ncbi:MAG: efflux RND transporter permease subunit, partial [Clostridia bacterium]
MVEKIVNFSIKYKGLIAVLLCIAVVAGAVSYINLPKQSFPEITYPIAIVTAVYPGATPEEMEELVTKKIERAAMEVHGYDKSDSTSMNSACVVSVNFDVAMTPDEIQESVDDLRLKMDNLKSDLPDGVTSLTVNDETMETAGFVLAISADNISNDEMLQRTDDLRDVLTEMEGVTKIEIWGDNPSRVNVKVDQQKLNHLGLSLTELTSMLSANNYTLPTGDIKIGDSRITVNTSGRYGSVDEIRDTIIGAGDNGAVITLKDIADITVSPEDDSAYYLYNGEKSVVMAVYLSEEMDIVALGNDARKIIDDYKTTLPDTITVNEVYFRPDVVNSDITDFVVSVIEAIIIVMFIVMLGMSFRNGLIVTIAIPLSILINFIIMPMFGLDIQFISLASLIIVLGMLVDSSVVVSDSIQVQLDKGMERRQACIEGTRKVAKSVFLSILTTCIAFGSMLSLTGTYKHVAKSLPIVVMTCLAASYVIAMVVVPMVCYLLLKPKDPAKKTDRMLDFYDKIARCAFRHKKASIAAAVCLVILCVTTFPMIIVHLIPDTGKP